MHALNLGNDGEDGQPDELQLRENVIAVAATQSSILSTCLVHCLVSMDISLLALSS